MPSAGGDMVCKFVYLPSWLMHFQLAIAAGLRLRILSMVSQNYSSVDKYELLLLTHKKGLHK